MKKIRFHKTVSYMTASAMIAAIYTASTIVVGGFGFGPIQFRISEALTLLPFLFPSTIGGIFIGCLISNLLLSPYALDVVIGSLASLVAAIWTSRIKNRFLAPLPPILVNAVAIGFVITYSAGGDRISGLSLKVFLGAAAGVGIGQAVVCFGLGLPLIAALKKLKDEGRFKIG